MRTRAARPDDDAAIDEVVGAAFGDEGPVIVRLLGLLAAAGHRRASLVAEQDGSVVGHVQLSRSWVDARERLVEVLVLSPLSVLPEAQGRGVGTALVAAALDRLGVTPRVVATTGGWLPLPFLVAGTDLVAAAPERLARRVSGAAGVTLVEPPFGPVELVEAAWWHPLHTTDPALSWLRRIILGSLGSLALGGGQLAADPLDEQAHLVCDEA